MRGPKFQPNITDSIVGCSEWTQRVREQILSVAPKTTGVFISGPVGTEKLNIARAIHAFSDRSEKPMVPFDCALLTGKLLLSQLFGQQADSEEGKHGTIGCLRAAHQGTVVLENIDVLERAVQEALLVAIRTRSVIPLGGEDSFLTDFRVIATGSSEFEAESSERSLELMREISSDRIQVLPLASRIEDIEPLCDHLLSRFAARIGARRLSDDAMSFLATSSWPGNERQLGATLRQAVILSDEFEIGLPLVQSLLNLE